MKKLIIGIIVSAFFVYFSLRGLEYDRIVVGLKDVRYVFLLPAISVHFMISWLRSVRWGIILSPIQTINQRTLYPITCVGFFSVVLVPMRMGEFVRPYLLSSQNLVPFGAGLATVFVERVLDVMTILGIFLFIVLGASLPPWLTKSGYTALAVFVCAIVVMCLMYFRTQTFLKAINPVLRILPRRLHDKIEVLICKFVEGFGIIASPRRLFFTLILSVLIWTLSGLAIFILFSFQNLQLSILAAYVVLVVNIIGISLPTAPGMMGNFQFAIIVALSLFDIPKSEAFIFSMVQYFAGVGVILLLGLVFLPVINMSFSAMLRDIKKFIAE